LFGLVVRFDLHPEQVEAFDELVSDTVESICRFEPGTLAYVCSKVQGAPYSRVFMEIYRDQRAFEAHNAYEHVERFLSRREAMIADVRVEFLDPYEFKFNPDQTSKSARG